MSRGAGYRPEIDGLRAIAVIAVITNHFSRNVLPNGFLGVDIFFVISGYVITASLDGRYDQSFVDYILGFYVRRIKRILPSLALCVAVTCPVGFLFIPASAAAFSDSWKTGATALLSFSNIYLFFNASHYFSPTAELNLFTQTWSLGVEEQFYLVFPLILWCTGLASKRRDGARVLVGVLSLLSALSVFAYIALLRSNDSAAYFLMPSRFWELALGCLTFCLIRHKRPSSTVGFAGAALVGLLALLSMPRIPIYAATIGAALLTSILIGACDSRSLAYQALGSRPFVLLGVLSYALYLWHWSVLAISRWTIGIDKWTAPLQVALTFMLAFLCYKFVEKPLRHANWSSANFSTIAYGLGASLGCAGFLLFLGSGGLGQIYLGSEARLISKGVSTLTDKQMFRGTVAWSGEKCVLSADNQVGKQIRQENCTFRSAGSPRLQFLVIGNSFSAAEIEMSKVLAVEDLGSVTVTSTWGASAVPEVPNLTPWKKANAYYWSDVIPGLVRQLRSGDIVMMIDDVAWFAGNVPSLTLLQKGLVRFVTQLRDRNIGVIFQTANPFMRESGCTPDSAANQWFHRNNNHPLCTFYTKADSVSRRSSLQHMLDELELRFYNFKVLDLFDVFCPNELCTFQDQDGTFLYRDEFSHPSVEASIRAQAELLRTVQMLQQKMVRYVGQADERRPAPVMPF